MMLRGRRVSSSCKNSVRRGRGSKSLKNGVRLYMNVPLSVCTKYLQFLTLKFKYERIYIWRYIVFTMTKI
jgi:hypothetical protein